jgi:DNA-binding CsgD family transcriptional regulator
MRRRTPLPDRSSGATAPRNDDPIVAVEALTHRMGTMPAASRRALQVAAVLGRVFSLVDLAAVLGQPVGRVIGQLQEVLDAGIVVPDGESLAFGNQEIRDAIYDLVPAAMRVALHRDIGQLLVERGGSSAAAAGHLIRGTGVGDREALRSLDGAIGEVMAADPTAAVELAIRALDLTEFGDRKRLARGATAAAALMAAGRVREATVVARSLLSGPGHDSRSRAKLELIIGLTAFLDARPDDAIDAVAPILSRPGLDDETYASAQEIHLFADVMSGRLNAARERAWTILGAGDRGGGEAALPGALSGLAYVDWAEGRLASAIGLLRASIERGDRQPRGGNVIAHLGLIPLLASAGAHAEASAAADVCQRLIESSHQPAWRAGLLALRARKDLMNGDLPGARRDATAALGAGEDLGLRLFDASARLVLGAILVREGDLTQASRDFLALQTEPEPGRAVLGEPVHIMLETRIREMKDGPAAALEVLGRIVVDLPAHRRIFADVPAAASWLVRIALEASRPEEAKAIVAATRWLEATNPGLTALAASARHAESLLTGDPAGLVVAAREHGDPWAKASAEEDLGRSMLATDPNGAIAHFERALDLYTRIGSHRDAARIRSRLRRRGLRSTSGRRPAAGTGWNSLSESEQRVATMVGSGLTNAQTAEHLSLSKHTVDSQLRRIFAKLDVGSRAGVVRLVAERAVEEVEGVRPQRGSGRQADT